VGACRYRALQTLESAQQWWHVLDNVFVHLHVVWICTVSNGWEAAVIERVMVEFNAV